MSPRTSLAITLLLFTAVAVAHHAVDPTTGTPIEWQGTIRSVSWDGAHVMYRIEVENAAHVLENWEVLGASPKILAARHIAKSTLKAGERVTVQGWLDPYSKIISPTFFVASDGTRYEMGFYPKSMPRK